jgi:hypothetical protein
VIRKCHWCAGHGYDLDDRGWNLIPCPVCHGRCTVPGIDPVLVQALASLAGRAVGLLFRGLAAFGVAMGLGVPLFAAAVLAGLAILLSMHS